MGIILNGILGGVSGKVAGVVGGSWKGINYLRGYAIPANPQTPGQVTQRNKLTFLVTVAKLVLTTVLRPYWDPFVSQQSGYNDFMSDNLKLVSLPGDYDKIHMAKGSLEGAAGVGATYTTANGSCNVGWDPDIMGNGLSTDNAVCVIIDEDNNIAFIVDSETRADEEASLNIGTGRTATSLHTYFFFHRGVGEDLIVSPSSYQVCSAL